MVDDGIAAALVDDEPALGLAARYEPALLRVQRRFFGFEQRPHFFAGADTADDAVFTARGDDHVHIGCRGNGRGLYLSVHAARTHAGPSVAGDFIDVLVDVVDDRDDFGIIMGPRIVRVEAIDIGQEDEQVGVDEAADHSRQRVVVADFVFIDGDDVVFIDDGNDAHVEHRQQGVAGVHELAPVLGIHAGQQDLADDLAVFAEEPFIRMHEDALADGGEGLLFPYRPGPVVHVERRHAGIGRAGADEDHLLPLVLEIRQFPDQVFHTPIVQFSRSMGNGAGPDLDDDAFLLAEVPACTVHKASRPSL